ncbi:MAG: RIP metalloprotease RseP [Bacteroidales bacterium]|nr:RIP metalloprotease RseP [Bacteroidales bacterium]
MQIVQLLLSLSILVFFHELGHFTFAKLFKTRVEKFYLFFNPWFSLFKFKKGETEYGIGWLPLGGYVKISGMIDESMDKEQLEKPPQPWEFRSKPAWQRLLIMSGGVLVNFILAFVIYMGILFVWGESYLPVNEINKNGLMVDSLGMELGLKNGDKIVSVNDKEIDSYTNIYKELILSDPHKITVERNGIDTSIIITNEQISKVIKHNGPFFTPRLPFVVIGFTDSSVAKNAGLLKGDRIIGLDSIDTEYFDQFKKELANYKNKDVDLKIIRNDIDTMIFALTIPDSGMIGVQLETDILQFYELDTQEYTLAQSIPGGVKKTYNEVGSYLKQLKLVFTPKTKAYKEVGSFITIGKLFPKKWDWQIFWAMTAILSIMLGVINILPIPALDGGHIMFTLYEIIVGKKPSDKFLERAQVVGMVLLFALMILAVGNDLLRHVF